MINGPLKIMGLAIDSHENFIHMPWFDDIDAVIDTTVKFFRVTDNKTECASSRSSVLSTKLFTDIVGSSEKLTDIGDRVWKQTEEFRLEVYELGVTWRELWPAWTFSPRLAPLPSLIMAPRSITYSRSSKDTECINSD